MSTRVQELRFTSIAVPTLSRDLRLGAGVGVIVAASAAVVLAFAWTVLFGAPSDAAASEVSVPFVAQGLGVTRQATGLRDHPARGHELAPIAAGSTVTIGGSMNVSAGLSSRTVFWVRVATASGDRYGFVPADTVDVTAGTPPQLDLGGADVTALLDPASGVVSRPIGAGSGPVAGAQSVSAAESAIEVQSPATGSASAAASQDISIAWMPETVTRWEPLLLEAAARHGVDPELLAVITLVESGGNPRARSGAGATGLMQVMPATGMDIARQRGIAGFDPSQLYDPETNIDFGAWYISEMLRMFGRADDPGWHQSVELAAAAYNGGPGTVQRFLRSGSALPSESARYRRWVGSMWRERDGADSPGFQSWWAAGGSVLVGQARAG